MSTTKTSFLTQFELNPLSLWGHIGPRGQSSITLCSVQNDLWGQKRVKKGQTWSKKPFCESRAKIIKVAESLSLQSWSFQSRSLQSRSLSADRCSSIFSSSQDRWLMIASWRSYGPNCLIVNVWLRSLDHNRWITIP